MRWKVVYRTFPNINCQTQTSSWGNSWQMPHKLLNALGHGQDTSTGFPSKAAIHYPAVPFLSLHSLCQAVKVIFKIQTSCDGCSWLAAGLAWETPQISKRYTLPCVYRNSWQVGSCNWEKIFKKEWWASHQRLCVCVCISQRSWGKQVSSATFFYCEFVLCQRPRNMESACHRIKLYKLWTKTKVPSFLFVSLGYLSQ